LPEARLVARIWLPVCVETERAPEASADPSDDSPPGSPPDSQPAAEPPRSAVRRRRVFVGVLVLLLLSGLGLSPFIWVYWSSAGHRDPQPPPSAPVAIVFGAQLRPDQSPKPYLAARLDIAAALYRNKRVHAVLVSGDASGTSGNEVAAMTKYLVARGVPAAKIVADPHGLDTYDTCIRAVEVYGVRRAILVSQDFHVPRAVTLCRHLGMDADGLEAKATGSQRILWRNRVREVAADAKAVVDVVRHRPPAVRSRPTTALSQAAAI
jgi:vancomycin permeability regulator SanA